jgi:hypothetical protein
MNRTLRQAAMPKSAEEELAATEAFIATLGRMRENLARVAETAKQDISHHSFKGYHLFHSKLAEHAALLSMTRDRLRLHSKDGLAERLTEEEIRALELSIEATNGFLFALSAIPVLPYGVHETFVDEQRALAAAKDRLSQPDLGVELAAGVLDNLDMAQMLLEEISDRAPKLLDLDEFEDEPGSRPQAA